MNTLLDPVKVIALGEATDGALSRLLLSFGASVLPTTLAELPTVLHDADLLIDRMGTERLADAGWPQERLRTQFPKLIHVSVTPFGSGGPHGRWLGSELVSSAMGGALRVTGEPDRPPVKEALDACGFHADLVAASGAMAALYERSASGVGQHIDVSVQEVAFSRNVNGVLVWQFDKRKLGRVGGALNYGRATVRCIWPLADGYCFHSLMTGRFGAPANQALSDWMDEAGVANPLRGTDWSKYNRSTLDAGTRATWEHAIEAFFRTRTRQDLTIEGRRRGINATVVAEPADVLADPHLQARDFWATVDGARVPGRFVSLRRFSDALNAPAPATRRQSAARSASAPASLSAPSTRPGPLAGVRVLDFSWALVGSITTKILGDLGADVLKVESRTRPCLSRLDVQVSVSRADSFDDKPWFAHLNTSKRSLTLDMKKPESRELLEPLIGWADVVVENFSPGTMAKLGLDYARLAERNPAVIMVSGSVFGQSGPLTNEWGIDGTGGALSGRTYLTGWPDRGPVIPGAVPYGDVIVPYVMAAATAAALERRRRSGVGGHIDAAMYEICAQQMYSAIAAASRGQRPGRQGNADPAFFHQGVYPTRGEDRWIAISVGTAADWRALCNVAAVDPAVEGAERDARLAAWTREQEERALMTALQSWGIAAGTVQDVQDLIERDPQLAFRGALVTLEHSLLGPFGHIRTPLSFSRSPIEPYRAPGLGEHTDVIARLAGLSPERVAELREQGVFR
jgi:crotonobetainyl-CoA:carnitine CoA-transferase CaiB-like acyl-CoA transferase